MIDKKRVIRSASSMGLCSGLLAVLSIAQLSIVARFLTPADYGLFAIVMIIVGAASAFLEGVPLALIQRDEVSSIELSSMQKWLYLIVAGLAALSVVIAWTVEWFGEVEGLCLLTLVVVFSLAMASSCLIHRVWLRRELRMEKIAIANVCGAFFSAIAAIYFALEGVGYWALAYAVIVRAFVYMLVLRYSSGLGILPRAALREAQPLLGFGLSRGLDQLLGQFTAKLDQVAIGAFMGQADLGVYNVASNVARRPFGLTQPVFGGVLFPVYARLRKEPQKMQRAFDDSVQLLAVVMLSISFAVSVFSYEIVFLILGEKWQFSVSILSIIPFFFAFSLMETPMRQAAQAAGLTWRLLAWNVISGFVVLAAVVGAIFLEPDLSQVAGVLVFARMALYVAGFFLLVPRKEIRVTDCLFRVFGWVIVPLGLGLLSLHFFDVESLVVRLVVFVIAGLFAVFFNREKIFLVFRSVVDRKVASS
jgi:O-antigen/teichoic acid export membrane protein